MLWQAVAGCAVGLFQYLKKRGKKIGAHMLCGPQVWDSSEVLNGFMQKQLTNL